MSRARKKPNAWLIIGIPIVLAGLAVVLSPAIWFLEFFWDWIWHDDIIALGGFEQNVRNGSRPASLAFLGFIWGLIVSAIVVTVSWLSGD